MQHASGMIWKLHKMFGKYENNNIDYESIYLVP